MKLLVIGSDRKLFDANSVVSRRQIKYAKKLKELHIIVFCLKKLGNKAYGLADNLWVYPTNSYSRFLYWFDAWRLAKKLGSFDVVSAQDPFESGLAAWLVSRSLRTKLHFQVHTDFLSPYFARLSLLNRVRVWLAVFLLPRANEIRVVSERIKKSIGSRFQIPDSRIEIKPIFVDTEKLKNAPVRTDLHKKYPQFDKIVLMASRLTKEKNVGLGIEAMREVIKQRPKTGLVIVGNGRERPKLMTQSAKLSTCIIFEGWSDDLASYYKTADVFLNTSRYEGYGMTIVEALACGCPVISTDVGIAEEVGATLVGFDPKSVANAINELLKK